MTFVVAQLYLTDALNGSEIARQPLQGIVANLEKHLNPEQLLRQDLETQAKSATTYITLAA